MGETGGRHYAREVSQTEKNNAWSHFYVVSKETKRIETEQISGY